MSPTSQFVSAGLDPQGKAQLLVQGVPFRFVGVNMRDLVYYGKRLGEKPLCRGTLSDPDDRKQQLKMARAMGARVVRLFLFHNALAIPGPGGAPATDIATILAYLDELLRLPEAQDLYFIVALTNIFGDTPNHPVGDGEFYTAPSGRFRLLSDEWFRAGYRRSGGYLDLVGKVVSRLKDSPRILAWEIGNELRAPSRGLLTPFMRHVAQEIRSRDPNHLISTGLQGLHIAFPKHPGEAEHAAALAMGRELYASKTPDGRRDLFDLVTVHSYNEDEERARSGLLPVDVQIAAELRKPYLLEEAGYSRSRFSDRAARIKDGMKKWFARGASGYMPWSWWASERDHEDGSRSSGMQPGQADWPELWMALCEQANALGPDRDCHALGSTPRVP